jgi:hypothetical protein
MSKEKLSSNLHVKKLSYFKIKSSKEPSVCTTGVWEDVFPPVES